MDTSRDDVGIAIRSAFLEREQNKDFLYLPCYNFNNTYFLETIETKPLTIC